ncbi:MAG: hypothetical protein IH597_01265 [Bacteroidales bacterium]|nr:hypothetical protein [Bacteroidales bacterium]
MKRSNAFLLIVVALLLGFGAAIGIYLIEKNRYRKTITQIQSVNLQHVYQLHEFKRVVGLDNVGQQQELFFVKVEQALPLQAQLSELARALSRHCFSYLPIEVQGIQEYDDKKVAVINLKESEGFGTVETWYGASWAQGFFQGSLGGSSTSTILIESFLQRDNPLPWIDGVVFLYEDQTIRQFDHVAALEQTVFRNDK